MTKKIQSTKPSVRSLAKATGFSVATISRVINQSDTVAEETKVQVLKAMQDAGYIPNPAARALATNRSKTIGVLVPIVSQTIFARFLDSLEVKFAAHGYTLNIATTHFDANIEYQRASELLQMGAEGLIFSGASQKPELVKMISNSGIPAICSSIHTSENGLATIGYDNEKIAFDALEYLHNLGHTSIAIFHGPTHNNDRTKLRLNGAKKAAEKFSLKLDFYPAELEIKSGVGSAKKLFKNSKNISAIFCLSDILALGVLFESVRQSINIPEQISLMGCDNLEWSSLCYPTLTTIKLPTKRMGEHIAQALMDNLDKHLSIKSVSLDAELIERESTAPIKMHSNT